MKTLIVIPARYESSRFPGKPLALIKGRSMLERVWNIATHVERAGEVVIATDDERIQTHARSFGARVVMTSPECPSGSARVFEALQHLNDQPDVVVNFQGDAVLTPPHILDSLIAVMAEASDLQLATPAVKIEGEELEKLTEAKRAGSSSGTLVTFDKLFNALYFSNAIIPFIRDGKAVSHYAYRHIGTYAYRADALGRFLDFPAGPLEGVEKLEQLRALENGMPIRVVVVDYGGRTHASVDNPDDIGQVEEIIDREGELV